MKEIGIPFKAYMVNAILEYIKTQTRRTGDRWAKVAVGDIIWVREQWCVGKPFDNIKPSKLQKPTSSDILAVDYRANSTRIWPKEDQGKWRPSLFMPRWASRITLEVTGKRQERLQDISAQDALAEGIIHRTMNDPRIEYQWLWESINGPGSWDANPLVWVIEFKRLTK